MEEKSKPLKRRSEPAIMTPEMIEQRNKDVLRAIEEFANLPEEEKKKIDELPIE